MNKKENARSKALSLSAGICFLLALALIVVMRLFQVDSITQWYGKYTDILTAFENRVETLGDSWLVILVIELNFLLKSIMPWVPISCICVISGVVFKWPVAIAINVVGLFILFSVKYFWGKHLGGGNAQKILAKYEKVYSFVDTNRFGSPLVLFGFRLIPCLPINSISQLYGSLQYPYWKYMLLSYVGFLYKLFSYTIIGRNVYDPISAKFIVPLIFLFFFSGLTLLAINGVTRVTIASKRHFSKLNGRSKNANIQENTDGGKK